MFAFFIYIISIYPKESQQSILNWVNEGLLVWRDKKKALKFSSKLQSNSADVRENTSALFDTVNIIRKFENANKKDNELNIIKDKLRKSSSSKLQSNSAEVRGSTLKKSLGCNTPNNSVFQHGLSSVENKSHFSLIDSFYKEESGRSCSSLPKDTTNTNDMQQFMDEIIEKSKKGAPIGTERTYSNGKTYIRANLLE